MKAERRFRWIAVCVFTAFIFFNSLQTGEVSGNMSGNLTRWLMNILSQGGFDLKYDVLHHWLRKSAHFAEYFVLGMLVYRAARREPMRKKDCLLILLIMAAVPSIDETIQLFVPERAGMITDVLLDMCGYLAGCSVTASVYAMLQ